MDLRNAMFVTLAACSPSVSSPNPAGPDAGSAATPDGGSVLPSGVVAVPLESAGGFAYMAPLALGSAGTFQTQVDTGSTSAAVAAASCTTCASAGVTPLYAATGTDEHHTASTEYADGSMWSGEVYRDQATVAGSPGVALDFASITSQTQFFTDNTYQGILGLGPDELLEPSTTSFMGKTIAAGVAPVMAFQMCPDRGQMWLGGFDPNAASAEPAYTPMLPITNNQPFYGVQIAKLSLDTTSLGTEGAFGETLVDTGTSISYVPAAVMTKLVGAINGASGYKALFGTQKIADGGCVTTAGVTSAQVDAMLPPMSIQFPDGNGGKTASIEPRADALVHDPAGRRPVLPRVLGLR